MKPEKHKDSDATLLGQSEAAKFLGVAVNWLEKRRGPRGISGGPPFVRLGGFVRYRKSDLEAYVKGLETVNQSVDDDAGEE